ncbi:hypothetical protein CIK52_17080 [Kocuria rosea]|uniref:SGNH/GDSL hydrolase family protein n=1 Tax=Kocuria rosea TaxID=1275 RepID=UPI000D64569B|nr:SGNH/GDSL hydrolase family protein [Kocuria rosea]PWF82010.1 hypothetical protein CIK52_17080 [Kocuria rosea]QCY33604.1 SGNH/GDSL hydrolase family protein [Kocuria rosea]TQN35812.1 lysophospholipase L1-like esterase [Kocuria rosea]
MVQAEQAQASITQATSTYTSPVTYTPPPKTTEVAFIGDSFTMGGGATNRSKRWTTVLSRDMKWVELNYGVSGTNYATAGTVVGAKPYWDNLTDLIISQPDIVIVSSAGNALNVDQEPGISRTYEKLREALPDAQIYATSPYTRAGGFGTGLKEFGEEVEQGVESVGGEYLDLNHPIGTRFDLMDDDDIHPNDEGHQIIADSVKREIL